MGGLTLDRAATHRHCREVTGGTLSRRLFVMFGTAWL
jgi:hypothetical protein